MMKRIGVVGVFAFVACAFAETAANDWENLEVNSRNRMPAASYLLPLASEKEAFSTALVCETPYKVSLNGDWKFSW